MKVRGGRLHAGRRTFGWAFFIGFALVAACERSGAGDEDPASTGGSSCIEGVSPSGGALITPQCPDWKRLMASGKPIPESCAVGGEGGGGGAGSEEDKPALRRLCEFNGADFHGDTHRCLLDTTDQPCSPEAEEAILACLRGVPEPYCEVVVGGSNYRQFVEECSELTFAAAVEGVNRRGDEEALLACIASRDDSEPCDESFLRCAYGLF